MAKGAAAQRRVALNQLHDLSLRPLTARSRRVIKAADDEAERLGHEPLGTKHLLLGLLYDPAGVACHVLQKLGVAIRVADDGVDAKILRRQEDIWCPAISGEIQTRHHLISTIARK